MPPLVFAATGDGELWKAELDSNRNVAHLRQPRSTRYESHGVPASNSPPGANGCNNKTNYLHAVDVVANSLKSKLPASLAGQVENALTGGGFLGKKSA